ncbi:MAG: hypothetical protein LBT62_01170 [Deltaproteobacteria bacterium]|nr:hypothetical protein [Deltaproteobacteria bacterium]
MAEIIFAFGATDFTFFKQLIESLERSIIQHLYLLLAASFSLYISGVSFWRGF